MSSLSQNAHELEGSDRVSARALLANLDVVLVALVAIPALALGAPALGYLIGAGGWILQRAVQAGDRRLLARFAEPLQQLGANLFEAFGRIWLLAGAIVAAALAGGRADGLTAALVILGAYSVAFVIRMARGAEEARRRALEGSERPEGTGGRGR
jgi:hypothetical protein